MKVRSDLAALFEDIFAATPWPTLMLDEDGAVLGASDETGAHGVDDDVPLRARAGHYVRLLCDREPWLLARQVDSTRARPSGALVHERLHLCPTRWGACLVIVDQTDLLQLQAADIQTARLASLGFMVAGVCHEVTNPLTSLNSMVQLLRSDAELSPQALNRGLDNIATNVKRILDISRRLVRFSRVGDERRLRFAIDDVIKEAADVVRHDGLLHGIEFDHRTNPAAIVCGHSGQVREIVLNLFVNALQAMGERGRLSVETRCTQQAVEVTVRDTGPGVPDGLAGRIFEPFFTTKAERDGTGLGLAISMEIAHEHGGSIELRHNSPQGATFCLMLPKGYA